MLKLGVCVCVSGPLAGPQRLRIEEQQPHDGDYSRHRGSSVSVESRSSNNSEDRIHLKISWTVRAASLLSKCY